MRGGAGPLGEQLDGGSGMSSGGTTISCSPGTPEPLPDVASTRVSPPPSATARASAAAPSMTCSQLSSTSRRGRDAQRRHDRLGQRAPSAAGDPERLGVGVGTSSGSVISASSTSQTRRGRARRGPVGRRPARAWSYRCRRARPASRSATASSASRRPRARSSRPEQPPRSAGQVAPTAPGGPQRRVVAVVELP